MSMILRDQGKIFVYSKGADSVMMTRLKFNADSIEDMEQQKQIEDDLHKFA